MTFPNGQLAAMDDEERERELSEHLGWFVLSLSPSVSLSCFPSCCFMCLVVRSHPRESHRLNCCIPCIPCIHVVVFFHTAFPLQCHEQNQDALQQLETAENELVKAQVTIEALGKALSKQTAMSKQLAAQVTKLQEQQQVQGQRRFPGPCPLFGSVCLCV